MSTIQDYLNLIENAIYGKDVRQAIHDGIQQCYYDGRAGATDLEARQRLDSAEGSITSLGSRMSTAENDIDVLDARVDQIVAPSGEAPSSAEVADGRIVDGVTYNLIGDAIRAVSADSKSDLNAIYDGEFNHSYSGNDLEVYIPMAYDDYVGEYRLPRINVSHSAITYTTGVTSFFVGFYDSSKQLLQQVERKYGSQSAASATYQMPPETAYTRVVLHSTNGGSFTVEAERNMSLDILENEISNLLPKCDLQRDIDLLEDATTGYFISSTGTKTSNSDFNISDTISLLAGERLIIFAQGYSTNVAMVAKDNGDNTYTPLVISTETKAAWYQYTATASINVVISYNTNYPQSSAKVYYLPKANDDAMRSRLGNIENVLDDGMTMTAWESVGTLVDGKQVQVSNGYINIANGTSAYKYAVQDVSNIKRVKVVCYAGTSAQWTVGYIFAASNGAVISQYNNTSGEYTLEVDVPSGATMLYVNNNGYGTTPSIAREIMVGKQQYFDLSLFSKFGVVGDSYASGELYYNGSYTDKYGISWGQILARKHGITCTNYSKGGLSTRTWLTDSNGLSLMLSSPAEDLYLLALGINDYYQLGQDYLGDITDITDYESYEDYGDTFYGNYGRIIEQIEAHAPHAKIIIFTVANTNPVPQMFSDAVIEIAEHYNIPYIVQSSDNFFQSTMYATMSGGHPTAVAYSGMATAFERLIDDCVKSNLTYFFDTFMYD